MKYLKIKNIGELDLNSFFLIGASTKKNDDTKIGQFGTGLKYAISYFIRTGVDFKLFIGDEEIKFSSKKEKIRDTEFDVIYCNGKSMNITTEYGYQWKAWEAIREIWCNAKDEDIFYKSVKKETGVINGEKNHTTFYIGVNEDIQEVISKWGDYFVSKKPIFTNDSISIFKNDNGSNLKLYKNGVLIKEIEQKSIFHYDIKKAELNELRQYVDTPTWRIPPLLLNTNSTIISEYLIFISNAENRENKYFEDSLDWSWCFNKPSHEVIKNNFKGFMFLHPDSTSSGSNRLIKVSKELFYILKESGLPCEKVNKSNGSYYGHSGGGKEDNINYKLFKDPILEEKITHILKDRCLNFDFSIGMPLDKDFDFITEMYNKVIFSANLNVLSKSDLESICLIAYIGTKEKGIYKAFKRLLKSEINNKNLNNILLKDSYEA